MTDAELQLLHPPIACGDGSVCARAGKGPTQLYAEVCEVGLQQSYGYKGAARYWCKPCGWRRDEPLKAVEPYPSELAA